MSQQNLCEHIEDEPYSAQEYRQHVFNKIIKFARHRFSNLGLTTHPLGYEEEVMANEMLTPLN